jgi:putative transposase
MDVELIEFEGESDHVHLLIGYNPRITVSKIVNQLKGVSSYRIRKLKPTEFQNKLWGDALWSPSYFACSCGGASLEKIKEYIRSQDRPD